jgi:hypothetical protein
MLIASMSGTLAAMTNVLYVNVTYVPKQILNVEIGLSWRRESVIEYLFSQSTSKNASSKFTPSLVDVNTKSKARYLSGALHC